MEASWQDIDGETIVLIAREEKLLGLNPVAARIWYLADGSRSTTEIARQIAEDFDQVPSTILEDPLSFVRLLAARGLVQAETS